MDRTNSAIRTRTAALMSGCALALVLAAAPERAEAQTYDRGFQGTASGTGVGSATVSIGTNATTINVGSAQTVINWSPTDTATSGTIDFLPNGTSATFMSSTLTDYTVLNRVLPGGTAKIGINGNVTSTVFNGLRSQVPGGSVWFYTPNGFVVGPTATISVGGLVMTTDDIVFGAANTGGDDLTDAKGNVLFRGAAGSTAGIEIQPGAQITGNNSSSYVALVAPVISQSGTVRADRSIAYVAAESADLHINAGMFDITVNTGTTDANGIVHYGSTGGSASSGYTDTKTISMVAVPKNTALTMLLSGSIGYDAASSVFNDGSAVVLQSGAAGQPASGIQIGSADFSSRLTAQATGDLLVEPFVRGQTIFRSYTSLSGDNSVTLSASNAVITALQGLNLYSGAGDTGGTIKLDASGLGFLFGDIFIPQGQINITGSLYAEASGYGDTSVDGTTGLDGHGGNISVSANGGAITADYLSLYARGIGGSGTLQGGNGYGGEVDLLAAYGGTVQASSIYARADGDGGYSSDPSTTTPTSRGGTGFGGHVTLKDEGVDEGADIIGGLFAGTPFLSLSATGTGGNVESSGTGRGGNAFGGTIDIAFTKLDQALGAVYAYAEAYDGDTAVDPVGGAISMLVNNGVTVSTQGDLYLSSRVQAGINGPAGAFAKGGTVDVTVAGGGLLSVGARATLSARADINPAYGVTIDSTPDLTGGTVTLTADAGRFQATNFLADVEAQNAGAATSGGFAKGGSITLTATNGGAIAAVAQPDFTSGYFSATAQAYGGSGASPTDATGGSVHLVAQNGGVISADQSIELAANAQSGDYDDYTGASGLDATGGSITIDIIGSKLGGTINSSAYGEGGQATDLGGSGTGGSIAFNVSGGGSFNGSLGLDTSSYGASATGSGTGGAGTGGSIALNAVGGDIFTSYLYLDAQGYGGSGTVGGGDGYGGKVDLLAALGGTIGASSLYAYATGDGGGSYDYSSASPTGLGGTAHGGTITVKDQLALNDTLGGTFSLSTLYLTANAIGGNVETSGQGRGGDAFGGTVDVAFTGHDQSINSLYAYANAQDGDVAYDPMGGDVSLLVGGGITVTLSSLYAGADAIGGVNGPAGDFVKGGTIGVDVNAGATLAVNGTTSLSARADVDTGFGAVTIGTTPDATGGTISLTADNGTFRANNLYADTSASNYGATTAAGVAQAGTINLTAANAGSISTAGDVEVGGGYFQLTAEGTTTNGASQGVAHGGTINLVSQSGGSIASLDQPIQLDANGKPGYSYDSTGVGGIGLGGKVEIDAIGGSIATSTLYANAYGTGGDADSNAGSGTGGAIGVLVEQGGGLTGSLQADASGSGGYSYVDGAGGVGSGGGLTFSSDATANFTNFSLDYAGYGQGGPAYAGQGGDGYGGTAQVDILGGDITWDHAYLDVSARGASSYGGSSLAGAAYGNGDGVKFHVGNGANFQIGYLQFDGTASADPNGPGTIAGGANLDLLVDGGALLSAQGIYADASASMSFGEFSASSILTSPSAYGGRASVIADGGSIEAYTLDLRANGETSGALDTAGEAHGGTAQLGAANDGSFTLIGNGEGTSIRIEALGLGGEGPSAANAFGGTATVYTAGGAISSAFPLRVSADAFEGSFSGYFEGSEIASNGFDATGGTASVEMRTGGTGGSISTVNVNVSAEGRANGAPSVQGTGGIGTGGTAFVSVAQGTLDVASGFQGFGDITISANGIGGTATENSSGGAAYQSGAGYGGSASLQLSGGTLNTTSIEIDAVGTGALGDAFTDGATASLAGDGTGGLAKFQATAGTLNDTGGLSLDASAFGGAGGYNPNTVAGAGAGGTGGKGTGGTASFIASGSASLGIADDVVIYADGSGGAGGFSATGPRGSGGAGNGGTASADLADVAFDFSGLSIDASGYAGSGAAGVGIGTGGTASFALVDSTSGAITPRTLGFLSLNASSSGNGGAVGGETAFASQVGNAGSGLAITGNFIASASGVTAPGGYGFTGTISGAPVTVGGIASITTPGDAILSITAPGSLAVTGNFTVAIGGAFTSTGAISTQANASIQAPNGIAMTDLSAGGTTLLRAVAGPVTVSHDLRSTGLVTVYGTSVNLVSLGALSFADADAIAGDLSIRTAGNLDLVTVDATGAVTLTSTGGNIHNTGAVNGVGIAYTAAGNVTSDASLASGADLSVDAGGTFSAPGTVSAVGTVSLSADLGMNLAGVTSGGTTLLEADNGDVTVNSLTSPGLVTAIAHDITIASPGALTFADLEATAGDATVETVGNLLIDKGSTTGNLSLTSTAGAVNGGNPLIAGGNVTISAQRGMDIDRLSSGGTTVLTAPGGAVEVIDLTSAGLVTASGRAVDIGSSGALTFDTIDASAGNVRVQTADDLATGAVTATGSITLISTGGGLTTDGALSGVGITLSSFDDLTINQSLTTSGAVDLTSTNGRVAAAGTIGAGGNLGVSGLTGISLATASSGGTTTLTAPNGAIRVTDLTSAGAVDASGRSVNIGSSGALTFADARATAGDLTIATAGNLVLQQASASGALSLASTGGSVSATGTNPVTAGGDIIVSGRNGIAFGVLTGGGTTSLTSSNGTVSVLALTSPDLVTVSGTAVSIASPGALSFADAQATAGSLQITTAGNLALQQASATGAIVLTSSGGAISGTGPVAAGGQVIVDGNTGVDFASLSSGDATSLTATNGAISIASLTSFAPVSATARSIAITSPGALDFVVAQASAGDLTIATAGELRLFNDPSATGAVVLTSTDGAIYGTGTITSGAGFSADGYAGIGFQTVVSGGTTEVTSANGPVDIASLTSAGTVTAIGHDYVSIASPGALTFADLQATAGDATVETVGNLLIDKGSTTGNLSLTSTAGAVNGGNPLIAGGNVTISAQRGMDIDRLSSGGTTVLTAPGGAVEVIDLTSAGLVTASGRSVDIGSSGALTFDTIDASAGNVRVQTADDLATGAVTATGSITLISTGGGLTTDGALSGVGITLSSFDDLTINQSLTTSGAVDLTSTNGRVAAAGTIGAGGNLGVSGLTGISLATASSGGTTTLTAPNGAVGVTDLTSAGAVTASGRSVNIGSPGALTFGTLSATAGNVAVQTVGNLTLGAVGATGSVTLTSTGGALAANGAIEGTDIALSSAANLGLSGALGATGAMSLTSTGGSVTATAPVSAGGALTVSGATGLTLGTASSGGATNLQAPGGALTVADLTSTGPVTARGQAIDIGSSGALTFADIDATAGNVRVQTAGNLAVATVDATGSITLTSTGGALATSGALNGVGITLGSLANLALGAPLSTSGAVSLTSTSGSVTATAPVSAGGNLAVSGRTGIALGEASSGGTTSLTAANGGIVVTNLVSAGAVTASGRAVTIASTGALAFTNAQATAGDLVLTAAGDLTLAQATTSGAASLASTGGALVANGPVTAGGAVDASGRTGVSFGTLVSGGTTSLTASNGSVAVSSLTSAGAVTATGRAITLQSPGSLTVANAQATAGNLAIGTSGALTVGTASASGTGTLEAGGNLATSGLVSAAGLALRGANVTANAELRSSAALSLDALQLLTINALAAGTTVSTLSGDIAIGANGALGRRGLTTTLTVTSRNGAAPMFIGGTGQQGAFSLDKSEAGRLFADQSITLAQAQSTQAPGKVTVGDLAMAFGTTANIGAGGLLKVDAVGTVSVTGAVTLTTVSSGDRFSIDPTLIEIVAGNGSIQMKNAGGALMGELDLTANTIAVADRTTLDTIASLSDFAAISAALDQPGPAGPAGGTIQAGTINLVSGGSVFIQNAGATAAYNDRRGFYANSLTISTGTASPRIAINGVIATAGGSLVGLKTIQGVTVNGAPASGLPFGTNITINGCATGVDCDITHYIFGGLSNDELEPPVGGDETGVGGSAGGAIQVDTTVQPLITPPLVDEPITGVGNDDLWQVKCEPGDATQGCPTEGGKEGDK